jgi:hypothetical protein
MEWPKHKDDHGDFGECCVKGDLTSKVAIVGTRLIGGGWDGRWSTGKRLVTISILKVKGWLEWFGNIMCTRKKQRYSAIKQYNLLRENRKKYASC